MTHQTIILFIIALALLITLIQLIKKKPQYLVLLGIRGFLTIFFIHFVNFLCGAAKLTTLIQVNPISLLSGAFLGIPGILLLYLSKLYLL